MQRGPVGADARRATQFDRVPVEDTWLATIVGYVDTLDLGLMIGSRLAGRYYLKVECVRV
jgi:hypothetical protein